MTPELLLVDDDVMFLARMARALRDRGYQVRTAGNYDDALKVARDRCPHYAVVDLIMPGRSGLELVRALVEMCPAVRVLLLTGASRPEFLHADAANVAYLRKPADADDVLSALGLAPS